MSWINVCQIDDVEEFMPKSIDIDGVRIGIFIVNNQYFAIENICPHAYALLTDGFVEDGTIECPLHEAIFNIETGILQRGPGCRNLIVYPVKIENDSILVSLNGDAE